MAVRQEEKGVASGALDRTGGFDQKIAVLPKQLFSGNKKISFGVPEGTPVLLDIHFVGPEIRLVTQGLVSADVITQIEKLCPFLTGKFKLL